MCDNNPQKLKLIHCRFASPVVPGDVLRTEIWEITGSSVPFAEENKGKGLRTVQFRTCVGGREVVGNGVAVLE